MAILSSSKARTNLLPVLRKSSFRPDIQGLRAIAVCSVVLYHAGVPGLQGGYVGVDIFFVISGFLIIGLLWREIDLTGRIHLRDFYARRIRRLLPASTLVALSVLLASRLFMPPLTFSDIARDGLATAAFLVNMLFARIGTQYSGNPSPSPFQHYWSLNVEEQFYLFLPLLLILCWWLFKRNRRVGFVSVLLALSAASLAACVLLTPGHFSWAFFTLPTRAWEMALGGILALTMPMLARIGKTLRTGLSVSGLVAISASIVLFNEQTVFPGSMALIPVAGTLAVMAGGSGISGPVNRSLGNRGFRYIGDISYSLYLWHWPLLVIPAVALGGKLPAWATALFVMIAFILASLTYHFVEVPFKDNRYLSLGLRRSYVMGAALVAALLIASLAVGQSPRLDSGKLADPFRPADSGQVPAVASFVPVNVTPALDRGIKDLPAIYENGCQTDTAVVKSVKCVFGDIGSKSKIVLFGDSHAAHWFSPLEAAALSESKALLSMTKSGCPAADLDARTATQKSFQECKSWRERTIEEIIEIQPDVIFVASYAAGYENRIPQSGTYAEVWSAALSQTLSRLPKTSKVIVLGETPVWSQNPNECLSAHLTSASECTKPLGELVRTDLVNAEKSAVRANGSTYVPTTPWLCTDECSPLAWNMLVYRDLHHLTNAMSLTLQEPLEKLLR